MRIFGLASPCAFFTGRSITFFQVRMSKPQRSVLPPHEQVNASWICIEFSVPTGWFSFAPYQDDSSEESQSGICNGTTFAALLGAQGTAYNWHQPQGSNF